MHIFYWNLLGDGFIAEKQKSLLGVYFDPSSRRTSGACGGVFLPLRDSQKLSARDFVDIDLLIKIQRSARQEEIIISEIWREELFVRNQTPCAAAKIFDKRFIYTAPLSYI